MISGILCNKRVVGSPGQTFQSRSYCSEEAKPYQKPMDTPLDHLEAQNTTKMALLVFQRFESWAPNSGPCPFGLF